MKKLLSIAVCASAVAAFATDTEITLAEVGVTAIRSDLTNTIVAVSYKELGDGDGNITISNVVKTANLTEGDLLHVFKDASTYETYTLMKDQSTDVLYWGKTQNYVINEQGVLEVTDSADASITTLTPGVGFWLVRNLEEWDKQPFTFYIYGKPVSDVAAKTLSKGEAAMIGNTAQTAKNLSITNPQVGDVIQIPDSSNKALRITKYKYIGDGQWKTKKNGAYTYTLPAIDAGKGFWYVAGQEEGTRTVSWANN